MRKLAVLMVVGLLVGGSREAAAQGAPDDRILLSISFGVESGSSELNDSKQYTLYDEPATTTAKTSWKSGRFFGGGIDIRLIKGLTVGVSYHQEKITANAVLSGTVPNPIFFNRPRTFTSELGGLERRESAAHVSVGWIVAIGSKLDVLFSGGPSFFRLQQEVVTEVLIAERGLPFTEVLVSPQKATQKRSDLWGYNVGTDVTYILWENDRVRLGGGGFVRITGATTDVRLFVSDVETKVGGVQYGFGGRLRF